MGSNAYNDYLTIDVFEIRDADGYVFKLAAQRTREADKVYLTFDDPQENGPLSISTFVSRRGGEWCRDVMHVESLNAMDVEPCLKLLNPLANRCFEPFPDDHHAVEPFYAAAKRRAAARAAISYPCP